MAGYSTKSGVTALLLCFFFGVLGVHRFYVGKTGSGIVQLVTAGGFGIWTLVDFVMIATGKFTDCDGHYLSLSDQSGSGGGEHHRRAA